MLASPFLVSRPVARYLAAPVWLGFIFLLDPINASRGADRLMTGWRSEPQARRARGHAGTKPGLREST